MKKRRLTLISFTTWALICGSAMGARTWADEPKFPTNEDLRHVKTLSDPRLSPNGTQALVQITDATADGGRAHVFVVDVAANASRQLTYSPSGDKSGERHARWLNDGSVLFLAKRGEHTQIFRLPMSGGEAKPYDVSVVPPVDESLRADAIPPRKADDVPAKVEPQQVDVDDFEVAPGGKLIAVLAKDPETPGEKRQKESKADALWVDHDLHGKRLYLLDAESGKITAVAIAPDVVQVAWSKSAEQLLALVEPPNGVGDLGPSNTAWLLSVKDSAHPLQVKEFPPTGGDVLWSDEGTRIYFLAQARRDAPPGYSDLFAMSLADRSIKNLGDGFGGSFGARSAIQDKSLLQSVELGTRAGYVRVRADKLEPVRFDAATVIGLDCDAKGSACVWLGHGSNQPATLYFSRQLGRSATPLNTPNLLPGKWPTLNVQQVHWQNEGMDIEGLLFLPPQAASGKVPLVVDVHGGPTGVWSEHFEPLVEFYVGQGWAVLRPNPRGSTGYGVAFAAANKNDLGGADYRDIMAGTDAVLARFPIDADKLALVGYSYGGEMAGFVEGKTQRFKAIVSAAPVIDQQSEYGTEGGSWYDRWFYGKPWEHPEDAWRQSPLAHVANAKTPFLLIQGEEDTTDPLGQSQEMYRALRQVGVHVEMVQYPREGHPPLSAGMRGFPTKEPWHGFDVRQRIVTFISAAFTPPP